MALTSPYNLHPAIKQHIELSGIADGNSLESFLFPKLKDLPDPLLFKSMDKAVSLIIDAIAHEHDILVWGDYDVDGITATALLVLFFEKLGKPVTYYIPDRLTDGYGLNSTILAELSVSLRPKKLLITVDSGISNHTEIAEARRLGFKVIVTDHHEVSGEPLQADATINPKQPGCTFPGKNLAGVGVAFYLASAIRSKLRQDNYEFINTSTVNMKSFLGFVALGTVADLMPLTGINRLLTKGGFEVISEMGENSITSLFNELDLSCRQVLAENISFQVAPAINAAGRMGEPQLPLELLLTRSSAVSKKLARQLVKLNQKRKGLSRSDFDMALAKTNQAEVEKNKCVVIAGDFHDGIIGITASRLVDLYHVPALVCCKNGREERLLKGSGRAPAGFNLYAALKECYRYLGAFGGHEAAAGSSLEQENFGKFKKCFEESVFRQNENKSHDNGLLKQKYIDLSLSEAFDPLLVDNLLKLEPLGEGNPKPLFIDRDVRFVSIAFFGINNEHFRASIRGRYTNIPCIGFNLGDKARNINSSQSFCLKYSHMLDHYNGRSGRKIHAEDIC